MAVPFPQHSSDQRVARHHDDQGHAEDADDGSVGGHLDLSALLHDTVISHRVVGAELRRHPGEEDLRDTEENGDDPHTQSRHLPSSQDAGAQPEHVLRPGHHQVAVHADAGQQQQAAVGVDGVAGSRGLAERDGEDPAAVSVHRLQGEREEQEEVGQRQVEQEHVRHGAEPEAAVEGEGGDDQAVSQHAQQEDEAEEAGLEHFDELELLLAGIAPIRGLTQAVIGVPDSGRHWCSTTSSHWCSTTSSHWCSRSCRHSNPSLGRNEQIVRKMI